jgi:tetratricopeptide (TPR) repeat protein
LVLVAALIAAGPQLSKASRASALTQVQLAEYSNLPEDGRIQLLIQLAKTGQHETAASLLKRFPLQGRHAANRTLFVEGLILRARGKPSKAAAKYRAALADDPSLSLVRAELAEALNEIGEHDSAKHHLKLLMGDAPDPAAAAGIQSFIDRIDAERPYTVSAFISVAPSTNINNGSANETIYFDYVPVIYYSGIPIALGGPEADIPENSQKQSGIGLAAGVNAGYSKRLNDDFSAVVGLGVNGRVYDDSDFNQFTASQSVELRYLYQDGYAGIGPVASQVSSGSGIDVGYWSVGPRVSLSHQINSRNRINVSTTLEFRNYDDATLNNGYAVLNNVSLTHILAPGVVGFAGGGFDRIETDDNSTEYWSYSARLGLYKEWTWGLTTNTQVEARFSDYDGPFSFLMADDRHDERFAATASLTKRDFDIWGYAPVIEYTYTMNDSNVAYYEYDSHTIDFRLTKDF